MSGEGRPQLNKKKLLVLVCIAIPIAFILFSQSNTLSTISRFVSPVYLGGSSSPTLKLSVRTASYLFAECMDANYRQHLYERGTDAECLTIQSQEDQELKIVSVEVNRGNCAIVNVVFNNLQYPPLSLVKVEQIDKTIAFGEQITFLLVGRENTSCKPIEVEVRTNRGSTQFKFP